MGISYFHYVKGLESRKVVGGGMDLLVREFKVVPERCTCRRIGSVGISVYMDLLF